MNKLLNTPSVFGDNEPPFPLRCIFTEMLEWFGPPILMAKNEAMLPASAVFGAALSAILGHVGVL